MAGKSQQMDEPAIRRMNLADSAEILRREGDHWITDLVRGRDATIRPASVDLRIAMPELCEGIEYRCGRCRLGSCARCP
jgi:hypothetical protein